MSRSPKPNTGVKDFLTEDCPLALEVNLPGIKVQGKFGEQTVRLLLHVLAIYAVTIPAAYIVQVIWG